MAFTFAWPRTLSFRDCKRARLPIRDLLEGNHYPTWQLACIDSGIPVPDFLFSELSLREMQDNLCRRAPSPPEEQSPVGACSTLRGGSRNTQRQQHSACLAKIVEC